MNILVNLLFEIYMDLFSCDNKDKSNKSNPKVLKNNHLFISLKNNFANTFCNQINQFETVKIKEINLINKLS